MDGLASANRIGAVEDVAVANDADTGLIEVAATVVAPDERAAVETFTSYFWKVTESYFPGPAEDPIGHVILEKRGNPLDLPDHLIHPEDD